MKQIHSLLLLIFLFSADKLTAQSYHPEYEEDFIGWMKIYHFKGGNKPLQVDEKKYSTAQLSIADSFANWMQASYMPKGALGDIKKYATPRKNPYHERYNAALPPFYGAATNAYTFLIKKNGKWVPENNLGWHWTICANEILTDQRLIDFNTDKICLFTMNGYSEENIKTDPNSEEARQQRKYDLSNHPVLKKYILYYSPAFNNTDIRSNVVILSKNNRMPFVHVTIGEVLQFAEDALPVKMAEEKQSVAERYSSSASDREFFTKKVTERFDNARATINKLREKYKNRLNEFAYATRGTYSVISLANGDDIFITYRMDGSEYMDKSKPVMRVDPALLPLTKTDQPQWIMIRWWGGDLEDISFRHMHESIINNFDFDYVYNFFFDPEKVKGKQYQPRRSPMYVEKQVVENKSGKAQEIEKETGFFFFDDFSSSPVAQKPIGWKSEVNEDAHFTTVVALSGKEGKWLEVKGNRNLVPQSLKKPLPNDFEISFDLAAPKDIPWGTKAFEFFIGTKGKLDENNGYLKLRFRAGFYGRPGEITVAAEFDKDHSHYKTDYPAIGFSNDKDINAVHVSIKKKGEKLELWLDSHLITTVDKAIPAASLFNWLQFNHASSDNDLQKYFISNIKVARL